MSSIQVTRSSVSSFSLGRRKEVVINLLTGLNSHEEELTARSVIIVGTILLCVYGIIGFPTSRRMWSLISSQNIRLGLDLKAAATWYCRSRYRRG